jgi:hypothetical protein
MAPKIKKPKFSKPAKVVAPDEVRFVKGSYMVNGQRMYGVNTFLDKSVLEPLSADELKGKATTHKSEKPVVSVELDHTKENTKLSTHQKSLDGIRKGKYIHSQIERLVEKYKQKRALTQQKQAGVCVHPVARAMFLGLQRMNLTIEKSEVGVFAPGSRLATEADVVCRHNKTGRFVLLELKTGYRNWRAYMAPKYRLRFDHKVWVSEHQRHLFQLFITNILFNKRFPKKTVGDCILLQAPTHTTAVAYSLPDWMLALRPNLEKLIK